MGLDMYLYKKCYLWDIEDNQEITFKNGTTMKISSDDYVIKQVAYWRKANAIHKWLIDNVCDGIDDCKPRECSGRDLIELRELCKKVLDNLDLAPELLPTTEGCFFGSIDYDEGYIYDLENTIKQLENIDIDEYYSYEASW